MTELRYDVIPMDIDGVLHDLDNSGRFVGHWITPEGVMRAIQVTSERVTELGTLGGSASSARGLNRAGAIVGGSLTEHDTAHHAFLYEDGVMHDVNALIAPEAVCELIQALAINDRGDIVAIGHLRGVDRVVLLKRRD